MQYILNADDFGRTATANKAIVCGFQENLLSRTTVMVNMPFYDEAKALARQNGFCDKVGLHINLTSGYPLTEEIKHCKKLTNSDGRFNGILFKNKRMFLFLTAKEKRAVKKEVEAQIERYLSDGFTLLHADSHGHVHTFPSLQKIVLRSLKKYGFKNVRIAENVQKHSLWKRLYKGIINARFFRFNQSEQAVQYFGAFKEVLAKDELWKTENLLCEVMLHPNIYDGDMQIGQGLHYQDIRQGLLIKRGKNNES